MGMKCKFGKRGTSYVTKQPCLMVTRDVYGDSFAIVAKYKTLKRVVAANKIKQYHSLYSQVKLLLVNDNTDSELKSSV